MLSCALAWSVLWGCGVAAFLSVFAQGMLCTSGARHVPCTKVCFFFNWHDKIFFILLGTITRIVRLLVSGFEGINIVWWVAAGAARRRLWANAPGGFTQTPVGSCEISMRCACCDWKTRGASEHTHKINSWTWKQGAFKWSARSRAQRECHMVCHQTETFYLLNTLVNWFIKYYQFLLDRLCEKKILV